MATIKATKQVSRNRARAWDRFVATKVLPKPFLDVEDGERDRISVIFPDGCGLILHLYRGRDHQGKGVQFCDPDNQSHPTPVYPSEVDDPGTLCGVYRLTYAGNTYEATVTTEKPLSTQLQEHFDAAYDIGHSFSNVCEGASEQFSRGFVAGVRAVNRRLQGFKTKLLREERREAYRAEPNEVMLALEERMTQLATGLAVDRSEGRPEDRAARLTLKILSEVLAGKVTEDAT